MAHEEVDSARTSRPGPPPLRIHHFMAVTVVAALLLSVNELLRRGDPTGFSTYLQSGSGIISTIATAIAATIVLFGFYWRHEGRAFFQQPGHWLLVKQALWSIRLVVVGLLAVAGVATSSASLYALSGVLNWIVCGVSLWAAFRVADTWWWRLTFLYSGCFGLLFPLIARFAGSLAMITTAMAANTIVISVLLMSAAVGDRLANRQRDWPHWLGVWMALGLLASSLVQYAWMWIVASGPSS